MVCFKLCCESTVSDFVDFYYRMWFQLVSIFFCTWQVSLVRQIRCNLQLLFKCYTNLSKLALKVVLSAMSCTWLIAEWKLVLTEVILFFFFSLNKESQVALKYFFHVSWNFRAQGFCGLCFECLWLVVQWKSKTIIIAKIINI